MAETTVGSIVGFMRMDASDFIDTMERAILLTDKLDGKRVNVEVDADTASAQAQLALLKESLDSVEKSNERVRSSSQQAAGGGGMGALIAAAVALGPALVPLAGGAAVLGTAFVAMGAAGAVAIKGVKDQMDEATPVGRAFSAGISTLGNDLDRLGATAAPRVLEAFQQGVIKLNASMPLLNTLTGELSTVTGRVAVNLVDGLLSGLRQLQPLIEAGAVEVLRMSQAFSTLMAGDGVTAFGDYARSVLPQVMSTLGDLVVTVEHLVVALAPLGGASLTAIQALSQAINSIPLPVLTAIATIAPSAFLGFKAAGAVAAGVQGLATALEGMGVAGTKAAVGVRAFESAAGPIGLALAAASIALTYFTEQSRQGQQAVDDLTDAFKQSHGAIDQHVRDLQYAALQQSGAIDAAKSLGLSLSDLTQASLGSEPAIGRLNARLADLKSGVADSADAAAAAGGGGEFSDYTKAIDTVSGAISSTNKTLASGRQAYQDYSAATAQSTGDAVYAGRAAQLLAAGLGTTVTAVEGVKTSMQGQANSTAQATIQMQLQNNAAGLLKQSLDILNGKVLDVESAQVRSAQATQQATQTLKDNKLTLDLNTKAGTDNRAALLAKAQADQATAQAVAQQTGSTKAATASIYANRDSLLAQLQAQGRLTPEIAAYIKQLYAVPAVRMTALEVQASQAQAALQRTKELLDSLHDRTINVITQTQTKNILGNSLSAGMQAATRADGGLTLANGVRAMAAGGVINREAMLSSRPILWAEAGPEAYIPLSPSKRARSVPLLAATNAAMGDPLGAGGRGTVEQHFHIQPTDPYAVAFEASRIEQFAS